MTSKEIAEELNLIIVKQDDRIVIMDSKFNNGPQITIFKSNLTIMMKNWGSFIKYSELLLINKIIEEIVLE